jgi:integrase
MSENRRPKGTGSIRERGDGFEATYSSQGPDGRQRRRSASFPTRTEARRWLTARTAEVADGRATDAGALTVSQYLTDWLASLPLQGLEANTLVWYRSAVERHIIPSLGSTKLAKLSATRIEAFLAEKAERGRLDGSGGLGPTSIRRLVVTLTKSLGAAVRKGLLTSNPMDRVERTRTPQEDVTETVWTPEQMIVFLDAVGDDRLYPLWQTAAMTGLRREEVCGLQWGDIDLPAAVLSVKRARVQVNGGAPITKGPKSPASRRVVDFDTDTRDVLKAWKVAQLEEQLRAGTAWAGDGWVFTNEIGEPVHPEYVGKRFAKLTAGLDLPRITMRQLRHSHATALLAAGTHPKIVQERLGHSSIKVTMDIYSSVLPTMQRDAVEKLAEMMRLSGK